MNLRAIEQRAHKYKYNIITLPKEKLRVCVIPYKQAIKITAKSLPKGEYPIAVFVSDSPIINQIVDKIRSSITHNFAPICGNIRGRVKIKDIETRISNVQSRPLSDKGFNPIMFHPDPVIWDEQLIHSEFITISSYLQINYVYDIVETRMLSYLGHRLTPQTIHIIETELEKLLHLGMIRSYDTIPSVDSKVAINLQLGNYTNHRITFNES